MGFDPQVVDLNGDGIDDIVSGRFLPPQMTFFAGSADGFQAGVPVDETGISSESMTPSALSQGCGCFADLNGDGRLDLVVGSAGGRVYVNLNTGTASQYRFGKRLPLAGGWRSVQVSSHSRPTVADWDGDGTLDLLVGDDDCGVTFFRGFKAASGHVPAFEPGVPVIAGRPAHLVPGYRARPAVTDWNNDGKLDLLVGNCEKAEDGTLIGHVYLFLRQ